MSNRYMWAKGYRGNKVAQYEFRTKRIVLVSLTILLFVCSALIGYEILKICIQYGASYVPTNMIVVHTLIIAMFFVVSSDVYLSEVEAIFRCPRKSKYFKRRSRRARMFR